MRLGEHLGEPEFDEAAPVAQPVVLVHLFEALVALSLLDESLRLAVWALRRVEGQPPREAHDPTHAAWMSGRHPERVTATRREPDEKGAIGTGGIEHGDRVLDELRVHVGHRAARSVREPVATAVERDDPEVPR